jgi:peptidyl-prolyl cis-trans isomerase C
MKKVLPMAAIVLGSLLLSFSPLASFAEELAKVNGTAITSDEFSRRMGRLQQEGTGRFDTPEEKEELLNLLISREVLIQEANRLEIQKRKDVQEKIQDLSEEVLISAMVDEIASKKLTEPEMKKYYEGNQESFRELHASHILVKTEEEAKDLKKKIDAGADFADLAKKFSKDPGSANNGGDLGFFNRERMVKGFSDAAFSLKVNEVSGPVKTPFGYHLIKAIEYRDPKKFEELKDQGLQTLKGAMLNAEIEKLKDKSKIEIHQDRLQKTE